MTVFSAKWHILRHMTVQRGGKSLASVGSMVAVDAGRSRCVRLHPLDAERSIWVHTVISSRPDHFRPDDKSLLKRFCEVSAACDHAAGKFRIDLAKGRPSHWLATVERLQKLLIPLCRQLRLSPLASNTAARTAGRNF